MSSGQPLQFTAPTGMLMNVNIPPGVLPGQSFVFEVPDTPVPMGSPMPTGTVPMGTVVDLPVQASRLPAAQKFAECAISFEPLHAAPVGFFVDKSGRRVSQHYFTRAAAEQWLSSGNGMCPVTRRPIAKVLTVPNVLENPNGWFAAVDVDRNGVLTRVEAVEALKSQFAVDVEALDAAVSDPKHWMWERWDINGDGHLTRDELLAPGGLVSCVQELFPAPANARGGGSGAPPISDRARWFDYWDSPSSGGDGSGSLEREEVVRALLKTLNVTSDAAAVMQMRSTVDAIWAIFDTDGSGSIERREYLQPDGLADTIVATMAL